jgi:hypothetical protein
MRVFTMAQPERFLLPKGQPSLQDLIKLATALTGRPPTPEEIEKAKLALSRRKVSADRSDSPPL